MNILCIVSFFPQRCTGNLIASFSLTRGPLITNSQVLLVLFLHGWCDLSFCNSWFRKWRNEMSCIRCAQTWLPKRGLDRLGDEQGMWQRTSEAEQWRPTSIHMKFGDHVSLSWQHWSACECPAITRLKQMYHAVILDVSCRAVKTKQHRHR